MSVPDAVAAFLTAKLPSATVYLYGSFGRGQQRPDSDVDVALLSPEPLEGTDVQALCEEMAVLLGREVDLIDLRNVSTVLQKEVVSSALRLRDPNPFMRANFEAFVFGRYARLNEERKPILDRIEREGSILGPS